MRKITSETGRRWGARLLLLVVIGAPAAASWHGLTAAGEDALGLPGAWSWLVPFVLDAAALYAAVLALRDVLAGDGAAVNRLLVWLYAAGSAALNAWHASATLDTDAAALFYAAASVSSVVLWDRTLRALRRDTLRERGAVAPPTPRFRAARWIVAPGETRRAWCAAVVEGVSDPKLAVQLARGAQLVELPASAPLLDVDDADELATDVDPWSVMSKADAVRRALALAETPDGRTPRVIAEFLADRGVTVAPTYVSDVIRRDRDAGPRLVITDRQAVGQ